MAMSKIFTYNNIWLLGNCPCLSWTSRNCLLRINLKPQQNVSPLRKYFLKHFWKIWLESIWNTPFWVILAENFQERQNIWKGSPVFLDTVFHMEIHVPFLYSHVWYPFRTSWPFLRKWNLFVQMVNVILGWHLSVWYFAYNLPKPSTSWFAHVNKKKTTIVSPKEERCKPALPLYHHKCGVQYDLVHH